MDIFKNKMNISKNKILWGDERSANSPTLKYLEQIFIFLKKKIRGDRNICENSGTCVDCG